MHIDKETYKAETKNRYQSITKKSQIVIGLSLRKENFHINRYKHKEYGDNKSWSTYTISRLGEIYEHYNPKYYSDYLGIKEADKHSISIVLENMGVLTKTPEGGFINWINEVCPMKRVNEKKWLGLQYWEIFPQKQLDALVELCKKLCEDFNIQQNVIEFHYPHKDMLKFNGIVLKSNYFDDSKSINPLFDLVKFNELLNN